MKYLHELSRLIFLFSYCNLKRDMSFFFLFKLHNKTFTLFNIKTKNYSNKKLMKIKHAMSVLVVPQKRIAVVWRTRSQLDTT